jgi:hypothetical protein
VLEIAATGALRGIEVPEKKYERPRAERRRTDEIIGPRFVLYGAAA